MYIRKQSVIKSVLAGLLSAAVAVGGMGSAALAETETELLTEAGSRKADIVIVSIVGNEITYYEKETEDISDVTEEIETEAQVTEEETEADAPESGFSGKPDMSNLPDMSNFPQGGGDGSGRPDMSSMPDMSSFPQGGGDGSGRPDMSSMPDMSNFPQGGESGFGPGSMNSAQPETVTIYLPVGVVVHTDKGTDMNFLILEDGDEVKALFMLTENGDEMITEIWMK